MRRFDFLDLDQILLKEPAKYWTYEDILAEIPSANFKKGDKIKYNEYFNSVEQAKRKIANILLKNGLQLDYKNGKDAKLGFRYPQGIGDPIRFEKEEFHKFRTKQLLRLVGSSIGLFPPTWLAEIVEGANQNGKIIGFDQNMQAEHIQLVPEIYDAIEKKQVITFRYHPRYDKEKEREVIVHPYFLKEYNGRWFLIGYEPVQGAKTKSFGLDRIVGHIFVRDDIEFIPPKEKSFASSYFKDIVGVTIQEKKNKLKTILIETLDAYTHGRIMTKPFHSSQRELRPFSSEQTGLFSIKVIPNNELDTLLLSFGPHIKVLEPQSYVDSFQEKVRKLSSLYFPESNAAKTDGGEVVEKLSDPKPIE